MDRWRKKLTCVNGLADFAQLFPFRKLYIYPMRRALFVSLVFLCTISSAQIISPEPERIPLSKPDSVFVDPVFHAKRIQVEITRTDYQWLGVADLWDTFSQTATLFLFDNKGSGNYFLLEHGRATLHVCDSLPQRNFSLKHKSYQQIFPSWQGGNHWGLMPPHLSSDRFEGKKPILQKLEEGYKITYFGQPGDSSQTDFFLRFDSLQVPDSLLALSAYGLFDARHIEQENVRLSRVFTESARSRDSLMTAWMERSYYQPVDFPSIYYVSLLNEEGKLFSHFKAGDSVVVFIRLRWGTLQDNRVWKLWSHFMKEHPEWQGRYVFLIAEEDIAKARELLPEKYWDRAYMITPYEANRVALDRHALCVVDVSGNVLFQSSDLKGIYTGLEEVLVR